MNEIRNATSLALIAVLAFSVVAMASTALIVPFLPADAQSPGGEWTGIYKGKRTITENNLVTQSTSTWNDAGSMTFKILFDEPVYDRFYKISGKAKGHASMTDDRFIADGKCHYDVTYDYTFIVFGSFDPETGKVTIGGNYDDPPSTIIEEHDEGCVFPNGTIPPSVPRGLPLPLPAYMWGAAEWFELTDGHVENYNEDYTSNVGGSETRLIEDADFTVSGPPIVARIRGTVKDSSGNVMASSTVMLAEFDGMPREGDKLQKLSAAKPGYKDRTKATESGTYEFVIDKEVNPNKLPKLVVISLLWQKSDSSEFAITNGNEVGGRFIPVYQALCVDNEGVKCAKWKKTDDGFEAELDFVYGSKAAKTAAFMQMEDWLPGSAGSVDKLMAESGLVYSNSYKAMKYFEELKGNLGVALDPILIHVRHQEQNCNYAQFDAQAKLDKKYPSFGDLGGGLAKVVSTGSSIRICDQRSATSWKDIPVNREWHELGHYLNFEMYLNFDGKPFGNHDGYANESTNDSLVEGFAEFVAMLIAEHYGSGSPQMYPTREAVQNLEIDHKVWNESVFIEEQPEDGTQKIITFPVPSFQEEWAIAGILWDLHDSAAETNPRHVIGQNSKGQKVWAPTSRIYSSPGDNIALRGEQILQTISTEEPKTLLDLYNAFQSTVPMEDLDMIFVNHGAFGDVVDRNLVQDLNGEQAGPTGHAPDRLVRASPAPTFPGSYLETHSNATFKVTIKHEPPFSNYDFSYILDMTANEPAYFLMPPSNYPSKAIFDQVSSDSSTTIASNITSIDSNQYWNYIRSNPQKDGIFKTVSVNSSNHPAAISGNSDVLPESPQSKPGGGCLIATAAFGSELTPEVQFLRSFRDDHILSTMSGSSFMSVFNAWYYSFSPNVADYERQQPWLQQTVRIAIYPLIGILHVSENAYSLVPGEMGAIAAGLLASSIIGGVYFWPVALLIGRNPTFNDKLLLKIASVMIGSSIVVVILGTVLVNPLSLMIGTSIMVLAVISITSIFASRGITAAARKLAHSFKKQ